MIVKELVALLGFKTDEASLGKAEKRMKKAGKRMQKIGKRMSIMISAPLIAIGVGAIKASIDFNEAMANVGTLIPGETARLEELKKSVQDLSIATGKSTNDIAEGLFQVISAFGDTADTVEILEIATNAAVAGVSGVKASLSLLSAVMKGYGDITKENAQHTSDLAFMTNVLGETTFPELAASMPQVIGFAQQLGVTAEELFTGFATLTGVTGNTAEVSTQLRGVLNAMIKPTDAFTAAIKGLGFETIEGMINTLGFKGSLDAIIGTTDGTSVAVGKLFGRIEGLGAVLAITSTLSDDFNFKQTQMQDVSGSTVLALKAQKEGINEAGFAMKVLKARITVISQTLGDALAPALLDVLEQLQPLIDWVMKMVTAFSEADKETQKVITTIGLLVIAIPPLIAAIGALNVVMAGNWVGLIVIGIAALVAGIIYLWNTSEGFRNFWKSMWNGILDTINLAISAINLLIKGINLIKGIDIPEIGKLKNIFVPLPEGGFSPPTEESLAAAAASAAANKFAWKDLFSSDLPRTNFQREAQWEDLWKGNRGASNINIEANIEMTVPSGTPDEQADSIREQAEAAAKATFDAEARRAIANNPEIE